MPSYVLKTILSIASILSCLSYLSLLAFVLSDSLASDSNMLSPRLLSSVSSLIGSLGYDEQIFNKAMSPSYWNTFMIVLIIVSFLMVLSSMVLSSMVLLSLSLNMTRFVCIILWQVQHVIIIIIIVLMLWFVMMSYNTATGDAWNIAMVVSAAAAVYVTFISVVAGLYTMEKAKQDNSLNNYSLDMNNCLIV